MIEKFFLILSLTEFKMSNYKYLYVIPGHSPQVPFPFQKNSHKHSFLSISFENSFLNNRIRLFVKFCYCNGQTNCE